jgi:hypothetical protein
MDSDMIKGLNKAIDAATGKTGGDYTYLNNTPVTEKLDELAAAIAAGGGGGGQTNVQSDWNETDPSSDAYIKNKPTIPESATVLTKTLTAGSTSVTFTNPKLTDGSRNNIYTSNGVGPLYFDDSVDGVLTLYFEAQDADVGVEVVVE